MPLTLNQVVKRIEELTAAHLQLREHRHGDVVDLIAEQDLLYPVLLTDCSIGRIDRAAKQTFFDFDLLFCDQLHVVSKARENELELFSDLVSIAQDFKAMMEYSEYADWEITETAPLELLREKLEDIVCAVKMQVTIGARFDSNRCAVPSTMAFEGDTAQVLGTDDGKTLTDDDGREIAV